MWSLCLVGILFLAGVECQSCPHGFELHENSCYFFSHGEDTWVDAETSCKDFDAYLAEVDSDSENAYLASKAVAGHGYFWIGLNDRLVDGEYVWAHSNRLLSGNGYWGSGEPDGTYDKNCVYYYYQEGKWSDTHCSNEQQYICETDVINAVVG